MEDGHEGVAREEENEVNGAEEDMDEEGDGKGTGWGVNVDGSGKVWLRNSAGASPVWADDLFEEAHGANAAFRESQSCLFSALKIYRVQRTGRV